jgi:hypothetical protein
MLLLACIGARSPNSSKLDEAADMYWFGKPPELLLARPVEVFQLGRHFVRYNSSDLGLSAPMFFSIYYFPYKNICLKYIFAKSCQDSLVHALVGVHARGRDFCDFNRLAPWPIAR